MRFYFRVEEGSQAPFRRCGHQHRSFKTAQRCAERVVQQRIARNELWSAVRIQAVNVMLNVVQHECLYDGTPVACGPYNPELVGAPDYR